MADDTSNLINIDRLETFDTNLKNYIDNNSQAGELLDEVVLLIEDNMVSSKAVLAESITNKGVPTTTDNTFTEMAANIDSIKTGSGTATADKVLAGETFTNSSGEELTGTIPSLAATTYTPSTADQTVSKGQYISGNLTIKGDSDLTAGNIRSGVDLFGVAGTFTNDATATAASILSGKTAGVKGAMVTGTIPSLAATSYTPGASDKTIAAGQYLSGIQTIKGDTNLSAGNIKAGASIFGVTGTYTSDATAAANQILSGKTAYVNGSLVTGTITSKAAATYTPGTSNQTIAAGQYLSGAQTIAGSSNLVASNIKSGVKIFNVTGSFTNDANATNAQILSGKTAYVNGTKITGTIGSLAAKTYTPSTSDQTIAAGQYLSGIQTIKGDTNLVAANIAKGKSIFGVTGSMSSVSAYEQTFSRSTSGTLPGVEILQYLVAIKVVGNGDQQYGSNWDSTTYLYDALVNQNYILYIRSNDPWEELYWEINFSTGKFRTNRDGYANYTVPFTGTITWYYAPI